MHDVPAAWLRRPNGGPVPVADPARGRLDAGRPCGLYVHIPFCDVRCPYCDFAIETRRDISHDAYTDVLLAELDARVPWFARPAPRLVSIYLGGGTPSLLPGANLARVIERAAAAFAVPDRDVLEITIEGNPDDLCRADRAAEFAALRAVGVNRISLGIQSFDDRLLAALGRNHDGAKARAAFANARAAGFTNISCDLMFGLPGQDLDLWRRTLDQALALEPEHLSCYALTVEPGTPFASLDRAGKLDRPDDDAAAEFFECAQTQLAAAGLHHYEVSSHARPGRRAVHNSLYWSQGAYLGIGCSAASFRPLDDGTGIRFVNPRAAATYLRAATVGDGDPRPTLVEPRSASDLENEAVWLALRTSDGLDRAAHRSRFGADPLARGGRAAAATACAAAGWLVIENHVLRPTARGLLFADEVAQRLWC